MCDVVQWSTGLEMRVEQMTATLRLHSTPSLHVTVVCRGPAEQRNRLFHFQVTWALSAVLLPLLLF